MTKYRESLNGLTRKYRLPDPEYENTSENENGRARHKANVSVYYQAQRYTWYSESNSARAAKEDVAKQAYDYLLEELTAATN